jgi:hypothetical protein
MMCTTSSIYLTCAAAGNTHLDVGAGHARGVRLQHDLVVQLVDIHLQQATRRVGPQHTHRTPELHQGEQQMVRSELVSREPSPPSQGRRHSLRACPAGWCSKQVALQQVEHSRAAVRPAPGVRQQRAPVYCRR